MNHRPDHLPMLPVLLPALLAAALLVSGCQEAEPHNLDAAVAHYVRSQLLLDRGDSEEALSELALAIKSDPSLSVAHTAAGDIQRKRGNYLQAARNYEYACKANPYAFKPHYNLGVTYQLLAEAAKTAEKVQYYLHEAVRVYLRSIIIKPDDFDANTNLAACYLQMGKYEIAEKYALDALAIKPKSPQAHNNLGIIYDSQNRLYEAIREYKTSLEFDTDQVAVLQNLGATYLRQGRFKPAIHVYEIAAGKDPKDSTPLEQIGACFYQMGDFPQALAAYEKALKVNPKSAAAYRGIGVVQMTLFINNPALADAREKALAAWNTSLELAPNQDDLQKLIQKYTPRPTVPNL